MRHQSPRRRRGGGLAAVRDGEDLYSQPRPALGPARFDDSTPADGTHACSESVCTLALKYARLVRAFHILPLGQCVGRRLGAQRYFLPIAIVNCSVHQDAGERSGTLVA